MNKPTEQHNAVFASESARIQAINSAIGAARLEKSPLARCIAPMMIALDWFGAPRNLLLSLPESGDVVTRADLQRMLADQGYRMSAYRWSEWSDATHSLDSLSVGSILVEGDKAYVYIGRLQDVDWWHDGEQVVTGIQPKSRDTLLLTEADSDFQPLDAPQLGWFQKLVYAARREIKGILAVSLVINVLTLAISLFTMFVYNSVIPTGSTVTLWTMSAGAVLAILGAWGLRLARSTLIARLTSWSGSQVNDIAMQKTLGLPVELSARMGVENNLIRLRSVEAVRQWFGGAGGAISADYPFVLIFLIVIAILGGWIVLVPATALILYALLAWPLARSTEAQSSRSSRVSRKLAEMTTILTKRLRALRGVRGSALWDRHLSELVAQSVLANRDFALTNALSRTIAQALSSLTVLATMAVGISLVLAGDMSTGGLIATMMLIWRITTPAQQMFTNLVRVRQLLGSGRQLQRLLSTVGESSNPQITSPVDELEPAISADRLYYRYSADREPALNGVSFDVVPGQIAAVVGPNGSGKTTLLELLAGARMPQNGRVLVAKRDYRQFDPSDYRAWHGYLPQLMPGLPISLPQSMRLRNATVTDEQIKQALTRVAGPTWWTYFGVGSADAAFDVHISPWREDRDAVRGRYIVRMASAIVDNPPLLLLDDPLGDQDPVLDAYFVRLLEEIRGTTTVFIATHRPDLIQRCDVIAVLNDGALAHFGPIANPQEALKEGTSEELAL